MSYINPAWPEILTNKNWQKKKGALAKMGGETGVGEAMDQAEAAFKQVDWDQLDARTAIPLPADRHDNKLILKKQQDAKALYNSKVEPLRKKVKEIKDAAEKCAADWKKNKLIPSASTKHAQAVADAADHFGIALKGNSSNMEAASKSFDDMVESNNRIAADEKKKLAATIKLLETAITEYAQDLTKAGWSDGNTSIHQRCRSMCNAIRAIPELNDEYWTTWKPFGDFYNKSAPDNDQEEEKKVMTQKLRTVITALKDFKANYAKHLV